MISKRIKAFLLALLFGGACIPALADVSTLLPVHGNPLTLSTAPYMYMSGMGGQSACSISVSGTFTGTVNIEGFYPATGVWTSPLLGAAPDGSSTQTGLTAPGTLIINCANMSIIRADATGVTGTPIATLNASGGIGRIISSGINGGRTLVVGAAPVVVTNSGNTATVSCPSCSTPGPGATPVSVQAGAGVAVATPSPGVFVISNTGVTAVTGSGNMAVSAGPTPNVTITNAPTFTGNATAGSLTATNLTSNDCLRSVAGLIQSASTDCINGALGGLTAGTGISIATPNPNKPTVSLVSPVAVVNGGTGNTSVTAGRCNDAASSTVIETSNCAQWAVASFVVPSIGGTVTITSNENKLFTASKYTPIFVSDGTHAVQGYVNATVTNSTTVVLFLQNVDVGSVGDTVAANAFLSLSGLGSAGLAGVTAGSNIAVTPTNPAKPTVAVTNSPTFTGKVTTSDFFAGASGTGTISTGVRIGSRIGGAGETVILPCPSGNVSVECVSQGVAASVWNVMSTGPGVSTSYMSGDSNADFGLLGSWYALNYYTGTKGGTAGTVGTVGTAHVVAATDVTDNGLTSGKCVQSGTSGILGDSPGGACSKTYVGASLLGGTHIEAQAPTGVLGLATSTFTFGAAYAVAPVCVVSNSGTGNQPSMTIQGSSTTTNVTVYNSAATGVNYNVICVGF